MKNKLVLVVLILSFFMVMIPSYSENVKATSQTVTVGFEVSEGGGNTQQFPIGKESIINTASMSGTFYVSTDAEKTGDNGFKAQGYGWWNLSYGQSEYFTKIKTYINLGAFGGLGHSSYYSVYFYNKTICSGIDISTKLATAENRLKYVIAGVRFWSYYSAPSGNHDWMYLKGDGTWNSESPSKSSLFSGWDYFSMEITNEFGYCQYIYSMDGTNPTYYFNDTVCNTTAILENYRIDAMFFTTSATVYNNVFYDDVEMTTSTSYEGGEVGGCDIDLTAYTSMGISNTPSTMDLSYPVFQKISHVLSYGYLKAISICINPAMYDDDPDPSNYECEVIGFDLGGADCIYLDGYNYRIVWEC
ncbi:MAG TPA: hypothetical protein PKK07_03300, partial [bacterium]|nr:hypothetical protein [bacterium]